MTITNKTIHTSLTNKNSLFRKIMKAKWLYLSLVPTFFMLGIFLVYPAANAVVKSFFFWKTSSLRNIRFIGFENYQELYKDINFWRSFFTLAIFIIWGFITTFAVLMPITYLVYKLGKSFAGQFFQRAFIIPMMVPLMVVILFWRFFYDYYDGILNVLLNGIGLGDYVRVWLGDKATALPALLFFGFPWVGGFGFLIFLSGFQGIDESLHEAAIIDGAGFWRIFFSIDLPLIKPQVKLLITLGMIAGIQQYSLQMIMTQGGPNGSTTVPGLLMYKTAFEYGNLGYGSTLGVALFVIILGATIINNTFIKKAD